MNNDVYIKANQGLSIHYTKTEINMHTCLSSTLSLDSNDYCVTYWCIIVVGSSDIFRADLATT